MEITNPTCKHEIDESSLTYHPKYGRVGHCKKCGIKMFRSLIITPKNKPRKENKLTKKERKRLRKKINVNKETNPQSS